MSGNDVYLFNYEVIMDVIYQKMAGLDFKDNTHYFNQLLDLTFKIAKSSIECMSSYLAGYILKDVNFDEKETVSFKVPAIHKVKLPVLVIKN